MCVCASVYDAKFVIMYVHLWTSQGGNIKLLLGYC